MAVTGSSVIKFVSAVFCLVIAIVSWVIMAEKLQGLFQKYPQPYFLVYWVHSWYSIIYVFWKVWQIFTGNCRCNPAGEGTLTWKKALWSSALVGLIGFVSAYFWYLSLSRTSVPANTAIYQSAVAFTFILSVPILREKISVVKILAVIFSICGVTLVAVFSERDSNSVVRQTALGYVYLVISTILYALLEVLFKKFATVKDDPASACNGLRIIGLMGIHSVLWMWPPLFILHFTFEPFVWPTVDVLELMYYNAILDVIFNAAIFVCIALSSPLFASVGTVMAIPVSILVDFLIHHTSAKFVVYVGMALIGIAFLGFCFSEFIEIKRKSKEKESLEKASVSSSESFEYSINSSNFANVNNGSLPSNDDDDEIQPLITSRYSNSRERLKHFVLKYVV